MRASTSAQQATQEQHDFALRQRVQLAGGAQAQQLQHAFRVVTTQGGAATAGEQGYGVFVPMQQQPTPSSLYADTVVTNLLSGVPTEDELHDALHAMRSFPEDGHAFGARGQMAEGPEPSPASPAGRLTDGGGGADAVPAGASGAFRPPLQPAAPYAAAAPGVLACAAHLGLAVASTGVLPPRNNVMSSCGALAHADPSAALAPAAASPSPFANAVEGPRAGELASEAQVALACRAMNPPSFSRSSGVSTLSGSESAHDAPTPAAGHVGGGFGGEDGADYDDEAADDAMSVEGSDEEDEQESELEVALVAKAATATGRGRAKPAKAPDARRKPRSAPGVKAAPRKGGCWAGHPRVGSRGGGRACFV